MIGRIFALGIAGRNAKDDVVPSCYWPIALFVFCSWALFSNLGDAALFEPDEGRNAEVAREILLLKDWVTPHYDFIPRLDKPIGYFSLVALSYKIFGVSEWSARLPSALAALACVALTYGFARLLFGGWAALWSALVLLSSMEFFGLARIVLLDMVFTFFLTSALCCFVIGERAVARGRGKAPFLVMYGAMGAATLVKGPIGFLLPAGVIFFYLLFTRRWMLLRRMELPLGTALFMIIAGPGYLFAELQNPGYLRHFLLQENVARFATTRFNRSEPWYFFLLVLSGGFFPWVVLLPGAVAQFCRRSIQDERLFLILWTALPLIFFSFSSSKLPHYILPIYPALAVMVGAALAALWREPGGPGWLLIVPPAGFSLLALMPTLMLFWPQFLRGRHQNYLHAAFPSIPSSLICGWVLALILVLLGIRKRHGLRQSWLYGATAVSFMLVILLAEPIMTAVSMQRSSKELAEKAASFIGREDRLVLYRGYPSSLPFYLHIRRPIAVVWSENQRAVLGSDYIALKRPEPAHGYDKVLYTYDEFADLWQSSPGHLVVFVSRGALEQFERHQGIRPKRLADLGETILLENR